MKIKELITILQSAPDKEMNIYIENSENYFTTNIGFSFDDNNDLQLYQISEMESELNKIQSTKIDIN